jgi:hypothetical protein
MTKADTALSRFWPNEPDGRAVLLQLTEAGLFAAQGGRERQGPGGDAGGHQDQRGRPRGA